jgi:hypothetical protein
MDIEREVTAGSATANGDDELLIHYLRDRDIPCPQCEYNLRGLAMPRCPECGQALRLSVSLVEPYLKAWITLLTAVCAGSGLGCFFILLLLSQGWPRGEPWWLIVSIWVHILMIPLAGVVVFGRRRILRLARATQWVLAGVAVAIFTTAMLVFFSAFR